MTLPSWAIQPLDMDGAAIALGVCRRTLVEIIKKHPYYERRGKKKVFYPEDIKRIREGLKNCKKRGNPNGTKNTATQSTSLSKAEEYANVLEFVTKASKQ